jgi:hypothetical protein
MRGHARRGADALWLLIPLLLYVAFAALVYVVQGAEPELSIDHIAYFKLTDGIRAGHPDGAYWRDFDALRSYAVLLAYGYDLTASHIMSLKLLLAGMTIAYLIAFERLAFLFTGSRPLSVLFSLLSAFFVSFGASFWGMTDFTASLNRTLVVPFFVLILWFFLRFRESPWRYASYPLLVALSLLHLSTYYLLLVLLVYESLEFLLLRRAKLDRRVLYFAAGVGAALLTRQLIAITDLGFTSFVTNTFDVAWGPGLLPKQLAKLSPEESWAIEIYAFPWRNMPPPLTTLGNLALSYSAIFALSVAGAIAARRRDWNQLDRMMLLFAGAVFVSAYGLQTLLWGVRQLAPIYPINFEEIRSISFLMIPSVYFVSRLVAMLAGQATPWRHALAAAIVLVFLLQPVLVLRSLPLGWREALFERLTHSGALKDGDSLRTLYARQYLGLATEGPRFYYSAKGLLAWLATNAQPGDRVLTDRNEIGLARVPLVGAFQNVTTMSVTNATRRAWKQEVDAVSSALASRNIDEVLRVAKTLHATLVVVPWPQPGALYQDEYFSVLRVG